MVDMLIQLVITELERQLDKHTADITQVQDAFSVIEDDVFQEFCQQIDVSNIRSGLSLTLLRTVRVTVLLVDRYSQYLFI